MNDGLVVYKPNRFANTGLLRLFLEMARDLRASSVLGWRLFLRDFSARYRQQAFGFLWAVVNPFMAVIPFVLLARGGVINVSTIEAPYPLYAFLGVSFWGLMQGVTVTTAGVVNATGSLIAKINFPRESLLISPVMTSLIDFAVKMVIFFIMCALYGYRLTPMLLAGLAAMIPVLLGGLGVGMMLSIVGAVFKDIGTILGFFFQFLMLLTPILYAKPAASAIGTIATFNPFYYLIALPRDLVLMGSSGLLIPYAWCAVGTIIVFLMGWRFYKVAMARIVERI